ncbi:hypothetical protein BZA05DRAFT_206464, partial [Tricharina praecox]|uniref:uncharacterized protein n=1 Tax=Tricharina praecox TaxID=43433 RepID=UPI00221EB3C9
ARPGGEGVLAIYGICFASLSLRFLFFLVSLPRARGFFLFFTFFLSLYVCLFSFRRDAFPLLELGVDIALGAATATPGRSVTGRHGPRTASQRGERSTLRSTEHEHEHRRSHHAYNIQSGRGKYSLNVDIAAVGRSRSRARHPTTDDDDDGGARGGHSYFDSDNYGDSYGYGYRHSHGNGSGQVGRAGVSEVGVCGHSCHHHTRCSDYKSVWRGGNWRGGPAHGRNRYLWRRRGRGRVRAGCTGVVYYIKEWMWGRWTV